MRIRKTVSLIMATLVCMTSLTSNVAAAETTIITAEAQDAIAVEEAAEEGIPGEIVGDSFNVSEETNPEDATSEATIQDEINNSKAKEETGADSDAEEDSREDQLGDKVFFRYEDDGKTLIIYGSGKMWGWGKFNMSKLQTEVNNPSFGDITRVVIENGVTTVGEYVFYENKTLEEVELPESVTAIGQYAFYRCKNMKEIRLPDSVTTIGDSVFYQCGNLKEVRLPDSVTTIGSFAFCGCRSLKEIRLPDSLTTISYEMFANCSRLEKVSLPDSVTTIGSYAFDGCSSLKEIRLPDSVTTIGSYAFCGCSSLKEIRLPDSLTSIGDNAFWRCPIEKVDLPVLNSMGSHIFGKDDGLDNDLPHEVVFREGWKELRGVDKGVFYGCNIDHVSFPKSLETLANGLFKECSIDLVVFNGKPSRDPGGSNVVVPGKRIVFPGTQEEWKATGLSKSGNAEIYFNKHTVTVSLNSWGKTVRSLLRVQGDTLTSLPALDRENPAYVFGGWYLDEALTQPVIEGETKAETDIMLYAKWMESSKHHVSFYLQNEAGEWTRTIDQECYDGLPVTIPKFTLPEGYSIWDYYTDGTLEQTCSIETPVIGDMDIYVKTGELDFWKQAVTLKNGKQLSVSFGYTSDVYYDGRKHVLSVNPAKGTEVKATASQNPDIMIENFTVALDGKKIKGITLKSCSYKNNLNAGYMQLIPGVAYDGKSDELKQLIKENKDIKKALGKLLKPTCDTWDEWSSEPILAYIWEIELSKNTEVYNLNGMSKEEKAALNKKDGVLVWNGKQEKISYKTRKEKGEEIAWNDNGDPIKWGPSVTYYIPVKAEVPGLYYQRVFDLGDGKTVTKKIKLKAGGWSIKSKTYSEDGERWTEYWAEPTAGACDYFIPEPDVEGGYEKDEKPLFVPELIVNKDGRTVTKFESKDVAYEVEVAKPGNFIGELPSFGNKTVTN